LRSGFTILQKRRVWLTAEQACDFYVEQHDHLFFPTLTAHLSSGPIMVLMLAKSDAIRCWHGLIGPTNPQQAKELQPNSLRARYGHNELLNALHGSANEFSARREINFFFGDAIIEPIMDGRTAHDYLAQEVNPTLLKALTWLCKTKPEDPATSLSDWLIRHNPNKARVHEAPNVVVCEDIS